MFSSENELKLFIILPATIKPRTSASKNPLE